MIVEVFVDDTQMRKETVDACICRLNEQVCRKQLHSKEDGGAWMRNE